MSPWIAQLKIWLNQNEKWVIMGLIAIFFAALSLLCIAKYGRLGYNALDLAIFNQAFWNTLHGNWFGLTIHPHRTLGDHAELLIPLLTPLYAAWPDPRMLLCMQAAGLALTAWPAWLLARRRFPAANGWYALTAPLLLAAVWLFGPILPNIALYEFHILPFALGPLLFMVLAYEDRRPRVFLAWMAVALLVREDVALTVLAFAAVAFFDGRRRGADAFWLWAPLIGGAAGFAGSMAIIRAFAPVGSYKFGVYYSWLGATPLEKVSFIVTHPLRMAAHVLTLPNLELFLGLLMAFGFLPLVAPWRGPRTGGRWLLLALPAAAQILLGQAGGGMLVLQTHYATLFLPGVFGAAVEGYAHAPAVFRRLVRALEPIETRLASAFLLVLAAMWSAVSFGPLVGATLLSFRAPERRAAYRDAVAAIAAIPPDAGVATSLSVLPLASGRAHVSSAHYLFLGVTQYAERPYPPPAELAYTVFDDAELEMYYGPFSVTEWTQDHVAGGFERLQTAAGGAVRRFGALTLYRRDAAPQPRRELTMVGHPQRFGPFTLRAIDAKSDGGAAVVRTDWEPQVPHDDFFYLEFALLDAQGRDARVQRLPLRTLSGAPSELGGAMRVTAVLPVAGLDAGPHDIVLRLRHGKGSLEIAPDRSYAPVFPEKNETIREARIGRVITN